MLGGFTKYVNNKSTYHRYCSFERLDASHNVFIHAVAVSPYFFERNPDVTEDKPRLTTNRDLAGRALPRDYLSFLPIHLI